VTALEVPCLIRLGHWRILVEPVGLEPTLGFLPLIKSQVSAIQFEYGSNVGGSPGSRIPSERLRAAYAAVNTCDPLVDVVRVELTDWRL
jgi:hypothetical protein